MILDEQAELGDAQADGTPMSGEANNAREDALIQQTHGRSGVHDVRQWFDKLLGEARLQRSESAEELHQFDEHPVVSARSEDLEQYGGQRKVVLWVLPRQLTDNVGGSANNRLIGIFELFLETREGWAKCLWELKEDLVQDKNSLLPNIHSRGRQKRYQIGCQVTSQVSGAYIGQAIDC